MAKKKFKPKIKKVKIKPNKKVFMECSWVIDL